MTSATVNPYALTGPCKHCPFRRDAAVVRPERASEIAQRLRDGAEFTCHKTTVPVENDDSHVTDMVAGPNAMFCGGALATMEAGGEMNQAMRIAERLGLYAPDKVDGSAVYGSLTEWVQSHYEDNSLVHCEVVGDDCEDPPGYDGGGSGVYENPESGTCEEDNDCSLCGRVMCSDCTADPDEDGYRQCVTCIEGEDWE